MRKLVVGLFATILFAVLLVGGVALADDGPEIEESVSLSGFTNVSGGCDPEQVCVLQGFVAELELNDQTRVLRHVTFSQATLPQGDITKAVNIVVRSLAISEGDDGKVATLTGIVRADFGFVPSLRDLVVNPTPPPLFFFDQDVTIVADEAAQTIVLTLDTDGDNGGPITYTFSGTDQQGFPLAIVKIED